MGEVGCSPELALDIPGRGRTTWSRPRTFLHLHGLGKEIGVGIAAQVYLDQQPIARVLGLDGGRRYA